MRAAPSGRFLVTDGSVHDGHQNLRFVNLMRRGFKQVSVKHDEIGEFAHPPERASRARAGGPGTAGETAAAATRAPALRSRRRE
jgi:hypothetical protein